MDDPASELRARLSAVPTAAEPWRRRYPQLQTLLGDEPGAAKRNVSRGNVVIAGRSYRLAVLASAHKQTLGPDHVGDSSKALPVDAAMVGALLEARTAVEVGALLATGLAALGGPSLPFGAMDRADRAGRPGQRTR